MPPYRQDQPHLPTNGDLMDNHVKAIAQALADELQLDLEGDYSVGVPGIVERIHEQLKDDPSFDAAAFKATALASLEIGGARGAYAR
jgi:hypothetical protein